MTSASVWVARISCGCAIDVCEECLDQEALSVCLYRWRGNGYVIERMTDDAPIRTDCDACREQAPRITQRMFA
jgi:hypothetical protein